jgi:hypothetical protein
MILLAAEGDAVLPDADDRGDDTDAEIAAFQRPALLDMRFDISDMPPVRDCLPISRRRTKTFGE